MEKELRVIRYTENLSGVDVTIDICYPPEVAEQVKILDAVNPVAESKMAKVYPIPKEVLLLDLFWKNHLLQDVHVVIGRLKNDGTTHAQFTFRWHEGRVWRNDAMLSKLQPFIPTVASAFTYVIKCGED